MEFKFSSWFELQFSVKHSNSSYGGGGKFDVLVASCGVELNVKNVIDEDGVIVCLYGGTTAFVVVFMLKKFYFY